MIEIRIKGKVKSGKTMLADHISHVLRDIGFVVQLEDEHDRQPPLRSEAAILKSLVALAEIQPIRLITQQAGRTEKGFGKEFSRG